MLCEVFKPTHDYYLKVISDTKTQQGCAELAAKEASGDWYHEVCAIASVLSKEHVLERFDITRSTKVVAHGHTQGIFAERVLCRGLPHADILFILPVAASYHRPRTWLPLTAVFSVVVQVDYWHW